MRPAIGNGKICYVEMPATDIERSAAFYRAVFGWTILLVYIMVDSVEASIEAVIANGGELVQGIGADAPEITARFRDPGGNIIGLYQELET